MSERFEAVALMVQTFGLGWQAAVLVAGAASPIFTVGTIIWLIGIALYLGANL